TVAFVLVDADLLPAHDLVGLLVEDSARNLDGCDLLLKEALLLGARGPLLAEQGVLILNLPADLVTLGHNLGGVAHHHVHARHFFLQSRVGAVVADGEADAFDAAANRRIDSFMDNLVRNQRDGLQSGRTKTVHGEAGDRGREPGEHRGDPRDVVSLRPVRLTTAQDHVLDLGRIELRRFAQHALDAVRSQIVRAGDVERSTKRLGQRRARTGYDYSFSHRSPQKTYHSI